MRRMMRQIPHDLEFEPLVDEEDTQPCVRWTPRGVMIQTDMEASAPILDDVERLLNHFEDNGHIRRWIAEQRRQRGLAQPY